MNVLCRVGLHRWSAWGGETLRDQRGKVRVQWQVCSRMCGAMRSRAKDIFWAKVA